MDFNDYQELTNKTAIYPKEKWLEYTTLGLVGEAGEIANKVKKVIRDDNGIFTEKKVKELSDEIGDVLWYIARLSDELGFKLSTIANNNIEKLLHRKEQNKISGDGDSR